MTDSELSKFISENPIPVKENPLTWWLEKTNEYPILSRLARKYLAIPATEVPSESLFSNFGNIITPQRSLLLPDVTVSLIYLFENKKIVKYDIE